MLKRDLLDCGSFGNDPFWGRYSPNVEEPSASVSPRGHFGRYASSWRSITGQVALGGAEHFTSSPEASLDNSQYIEGTRGAHCHIAGHEAIVRPTEPRLPTPRNGAATATTTSTPKNCSADALSCIRNERNPSLSLAMLSMCLSQGCGRCFSVLPLLERLDDPRILLIQATTTRLGLKTIVKKPQRCFLNQSTLHSEFTRLTED